MRPQTNRNKGKGRSHDTGRTKIVNKEQLVYVALHNVNRRGWDKMELGWFLQQRKRDGKQLLA